MKQAIEDLPEKLDSSVSESNSLIYLFTYQSRRWRKFFSWSKAIDMFGKSPSKEK